MKKGFKIFLVIAAVLFAGILFVFSPYFNVTEVIINGNIRVSAEEIHAKLGIDENPNIFLISSNGAGERIKQNLYVDEVAFEKNFPNNLTVNIRERHLSGYVEYMDGQFLYIDENGRVLEINTFFTETYPIVAGLKFDKVRLGEILEVDDRAAFTTVVQYARLLNNHQLTKDVSKIDVSDVDNTRITLYNLEFNVGDAKNGDEKVRTIKDTVDKLPNVESLKALFDYSEIAKQYVGKILS